MNCLAETQNANTTSSRNLSEKSTPDLAVSKQHNKEEIKVAAATQKESIKKVPRSPEKPLLTKENKKNEEVTMNLPEQTSTGKQDMSPSTHQLVVETHKHIAEERQQLPHP